jgi:uncharacterized protein (TIGR02599 family)
MLRSSSPLHFRRQPRAFTLVELLVSMTVLAMIMVVSAQVITETQRTWTQGSARAEQFREARVAFEAITQNLRQATLNPYTTYLYSNGTTVPSDKTDAPQSYVRKSELQFITGRSATLLGGGDASTTPLHSVFFQAALGVSNRTGYDGMTNLLCGRGYFVSYGSDLGWRPPHVTINRNRYRLMEYRPASEKNSVYSVDSGLWFADALSQGVTAADSGTYRAATRPVAENIMALIISPRVAKENLAGGGGDPTWIAPNYEYDSTKVVVGGGNTDPQGTQHMLPPIVTVTLVAIDEASARKLEETAGANAPSVIPSNLFTNVANFENDLNSLEASLVANKLTYRVFSSAVALRNAKWKNL